MTIIAKHPTELFEAAKGNGAAALAVAAVSLETQHAAEQFLYRQAEILDDRSWEEWLGLFGEDGLYWMPAQEGQITAEDVPNIFYEDQYLMRTRIMRIQHPNAWSQTPRNRTSHVVSNVIVESENPETGDLVVRSKYYMAEYRMDAMRYFAGKYKHWLTRTGDGFQIRLQRVDLVNVEGPFDYVLQVWV